MMILQRGSKGKTVGRLQRFLNSKCYSVGEVDEDFGAKTEIALQRWQLDNDLSADGKSEPLKKALVLARKADIAVEIHFNASANPAATGTEVLAKPKHRKLAQDLAKAISATLGIPARGGDGGWKSDSSGFHHRLAFCEANGLIIEIAFISNPNDMKAYTANFERLCQALADVLAAA